MTLADLRDEYRTIRIGPKILAEVKDNVHRVVLGGRYSPEIYGRAASWDDAEEDVIQGVVTDVLLHEGQLDFLMATALTLDDFRALLRRQVRRYLARGRQRTVIDNLLDRTKDLLRQAPFESTTGARPRFWMGGTKVRHDEPTDAEIVSTARSVSLVPRVPFTIRDRAPIIYSRDSLVTVLRTIADTLPTSFSFQNLDAILRLVLTDWVAGFLYDFEEVQEQISPSLAPEDEVMAAEATEQILKACNPQHLVVLRRKLENRPDQAIAEELRISRPTVIARKKEALRIIGDALSGLSGPVQRSVMDQVSARLATARSGETP